VPTPTDPDLAQLKASLITAAQTTGPREIRRLRTVIAHLKAGKIGAALVAAGRSALVIHYRLWGKPGRALGIQTIRASFARLAKNPSVLQDLEEVLAWSDDESRIGVPPIDLPFASELELHATYGNDEIKAALGGASLESSGVAGVGRLHFPEIKAIAALVTFQKTAKEFSPSTMFKDYPSSRELLHWETPSQTSQTHKSGKDLILHEDRGYTMLFFARSKKRQDGITIPFKFLGPATIVSYQSERPIQTIWRLAHPMPAEMFEENRHGG
jgi:hypothetical protein